MESRIWAVSRLEYLNANGVTNTDIINMSNLVSIFRNSDFLSDPLDQNTDKDSENNSSHTKTNETIYWQQFIAKLLNLNSSLSDPLDQNTDKDSENNSSHTKTNETIYWQQFIAKLLNLRNINREINKQISNLNNLNKQIGILNDNKQQLEKAYTDVVSNLNNILSKIINPSMQQDR